MSKKGTINYSNGKIYIIKNTENDRAYVGSTCDTLNKRFSNHKLSINHERSSKKKLYVAMRDIGPDKFYIELIELFPCEHVTQLRAREAHWIRQCKSHDEFGYNKIINLRTNAEYTQDHIEKVKEYQRTYRESHTDQRREYQKEYKDRNSELIKVNNARYHEQNKDKHNQQSKNYHILNREYMLQKQKEYRNEHIDQLREYDRQRSREKATCECGCVITKRNIHVHRTSTKHQTLMNNKQ